MEKHMKIWILVVEHHNGRDLFPCSSYERAWKRLDEYVQDFWSSSGGHIPPDPPTPGDPASMTAEARIETFFRFWEDKRHEQYEIEECDLIE
jgi:hypothetical protein